MNKDVFLFIILHIKILGGWEGTAPGRPYVVLLDSDRVVLEWAPAVPDSNSAPVAGYEV